MSSTAEYVEFRGQRWFVADAEWDKSDLGIGSHWHLTLTGPVDANGHSALAVSGEGDEAKSVPIGPISGGDQ